MHQSTTDIRIVPLPTGQDVIRGSDSNGEKNNELGPRPQFHRGLPSRNQPFEGGLTVS